jgi:hypothetical protein
MVVGGRTIPKIKVYRVRTPGNRPLDEAPRLKVNYFEADK